MDTQVGSRNFTQLVSQLETRATAKAAAVKKAAGEDVVPEKDPADKGGVAIPKDPNTTPAAQLLPNQTANSDVTPTTSAPPIATTIKGEEKPAKVSERAGAIITSIQNLRKQAGGATAESITPTLPKANNENADKNPANLPGTDKDKTPKNPDPNVKAGGAGDMPTTVDPAAEKAKTPAGDSKGELPKGKDNTDKTTAGSTDKAASEEELNFDPMVLCKIASLVMAVEDGRAIVVREIEKANGAAAAADIIKSAAFMEQEMVKAQSLEEAGAAAAQALWDNATTEERSKIVKLAMVHEQGVAKYRTTLEKTAYENGAATSSQLADSGMPDAAPGQHPMESDNVSDEDIMQVLQQLVQSGQITPEVAQEIMQSVGGGEGGAEGAAGAPGGEDPAAGGAAPGGMPPGMEGGAGGEEASPEQKEAAAVLRKSASVVESLFAEIKAAAAKAA